MLVSIRGAYGASISTRGNVAERVVHLAVVAPAEVLDDGELELRPGAPDAVGDELGLEGVDEALRERVVIGIPDRTDRGEHAVVGQRLGVVDAGVLGEPRSLWCTRATSAPGRRWPSAIRNASSTSLVHMWAASCLPTTRRL
jgi:hypothetical protein